SKSETGIEGNNARAHAYYMNPNIFFAGTRDRVNQTLQTMFFKVPKEMKELPVKLIN
ncbi:hypothetical protein QF029_005745, partial [Priestia megaterium]|nr:hypothetical protein [Priestia megaterium]